MVKNRFELRPQTRELEKTSETGDKIIDLRVAKANEKFSRRKVSSRTDGKKWTTLVLEINASARERTIAGESPRSDILESCKKFSHSPDQTQSS